MGVVHELLPFLEQYRLQAISLRSNVGGVLIDWSSEFDAYLTRLEESDQADDQRRLDLLYAELEVLADLE